MEESDQMPSQIAVVISKLTNSWNASLGESLSSDQELVDGHGGIAGDNLASEEVQLDLLDCGG